MSIITCPHCKAQLNAPPSASGRTAICHHCQGRFEIPLPSALPALNAQSDARRELTEGLHSLESIANDLARRITFKRMLAVLCLALPILTGLVLLLPRMEITRILFLASALLLFALSLASLAGLKSQVFAWNEKGKIILLGVFAFSTALLLYFDAPTPANAHPVFNTPLSGRPEARPAIQVDVVNAKHGVFGATYVLYLCVKSSRSENAVMFPLNNTIRGCTSAYIQLPFEVVNDDKLIFELVYQSGLSLQEQQLVLDASKAAGYCLIYAGEIHWPNHETLASAAFMSATDVIGRSLNLRFEEKLTSLANCEYIVDGARPHGAQNANKVTLAEDHGGIVRAHVRVYYPLLPLD